MGRLKQRNVTGENVNHIRLTLNSSAMRLLKAVAALRDQTMSDLLSTIVQDWMKEKKVQDLIDEVSKKVN